MRRSARTDDGRGEVRRKYAKWWAAAHVSLPTQITSTSGGYRGCSSSPRGAGLRKQPGAQIRRS